MTDRLIRKGIGVSEETTIHETPDVCGGYPCVGNTRVPVQVVVLAYRALRSVERVVAAYPQLSREQVQAALKYYEVNPARVDADIETEARAWEEITIRPWPA